MVHPSVARAASAVLVEVVVLDLESLPRIILWDSNVDTISPEVVIKYSEGITGSHFGVVGKDLMMTPRHSASLMGALLRLSIATLRARNSLRWS